MTPSTGLPVATYWKTVRQRFANPMIDHRLDQIAQDGAAKLAERIVPLMTTNLKSGDPIDGLASVLHAWRQSSGHDASLSFPSEPALFPAGRQMDLS